MFDKLDVFQTSAAMARHAGQAQAVTAQNIANADTPGYIAKRLPEFRATYERPDASAQTFATRAKHLHGRMSGSRMAAPYQHTQEAAPNGNAVSLELEMVTAANAKSQHDRALAIYKSALNVLRMTTRK